MTRWTVFKNFSRQVCTTSCTVSFRTFLKRKNSRWHKYSDPLLSTQLKHLWQRLQPPVYLGMTWQALHTWRFSAILLCRSSQALSRWGPSGDSNFHVSPEMFDWVQVRTLAGPLKDIHRRLGYVLRVIVLLEGEPLAQSEIMSAQDSFLLGYPWTSAPFSFPSTLTSLPVTAAEKHPHSMILPSPSFTVGMALGRWWAVPGFLKI